jgi:hypothetical protein
MTKGIKFVLFVLCTLIVVCASGCGGGDDGSSSCVPGQGQYQSTADGSWKPCPAMDSTTGKVIKPTASPSKPSTPNVVEKIGDDMAKQITSGTLGKAVQNAHAAGLCPNGTQRDSDGDCPFGVK